MTQSEFILGLVQILCLVAGAYASAWGESVVRGLMAALISACVIYVFKIGEPTFGTPIMGALFGVIGFGLVRFSRAFVRGLVAFVNGFYVATFKRRAN